MTDPTEVVGVLRTHLEEVQTALDWCMHHFQALDLADSYRGGKSASKGRITTLTERAYKHVTGYLDAADEPND